MIYTKEQRAELVQIELETVKTAAQEYMRRCRPFISVANDRIQIMENFFAVQLAETHVKLKEVIETVREMGGKI